MLLLRRATAVAAGLGTTTAIHDVAVRRSFSERVDNRLNAADRLSDSTSAVPDPAASLLSSGVEGAAGISIVSGCGAAAMAKAALQGMSSAGQTRIAVDVNETLQLTAEALLAPTTVSAFVARAARHIGARPAPLDELCSGPQRLVICLQQRHIEDASVAQWLRSTAVPIGSTVVVVASDAR